MNFWMGGAAFLLIATSAHAQDVTTPWAGAYIGAGATQSRFDPTDTSGTVSLPTAKDTGVSLLAGYNWQRGALVFGGEAALTMGGAVASNDCGQPESTCRTDVENFWTVRGRVGMVRGDTLLFGTLGYTADEWSLTVATGGALDSAAVRYHGVALGIGAEQKLTEQFSLRADLEHYAYGSRSNAASLPVDYSTTLLRFSAVLGF